MLFDVFIDRDRSAGAEPRYFLDHDPSVSVELVKHLRRFVLRSKVKIEDVSPDYAVSAVWPADGSDASALSITRDERTPNIGWRAVHGRADQAWTGEQLAERLGAEVVDDRAYQVHRILEGVPEGPDDFVAASTIPLEANLDYTGASALRAQRSRSLCSRLPQGLLRRPGADGANAPHRRHSKTHPAWPLLPRGRRVRLLVPALAHCPDRRRRSCLRRGLHRGPARRPWRTRRHRTRTCDRSRRRPSSRDPGRAARQDRSSPSRMPQRPTHRPCSSV